MSEVLENIWNTIKSLPSLIEKIIEYINNSLNFLPNELKIPFSALIFIIFGIFIYRLIK